MHNVPVQPLAPTEASQPPIHGPERRMRLREGPNGAAGDHVAGLPLSQIHIGTDQKNTIFALFWPENASN